MIITITSKSWRWLCLAAATIILGNSAMACPQPPGYGFVLHAEESDSYGGFTVTTNAGGVGLLGNKINDAAGAQGTVNNFQGYANSQGYYTVTGGRTPAYWDVFETTGPCQGQKVLGLSLINPSTDPVTIVCMVTSQGFNANPSYMYQNQSTSLILTGSGIDTTYGQPMLLMCDNSGAEMDMTNGWANDSTTVSGNLFCNSVGNYVIMVQNAASGGGYTTIGGAPISVYYYY